MLPLGAPTHAHETPNEHPGTALALALEIAASIYRSPGDELRADIAQGNLEDAVANCASRMGWTPPTLQTDNWPVLQAAYVDLFVSSARGLAGPPYVGLAIDNELLGPSVDAWKALLAEQALALDASWSDLPDHVALVAEAASLLWDAGRTDTAATIAQQFLAPWFQRYGARVVAADSSGFYGPLTEFLASVMGEVACEASS